MTVYDLYQQYLNQLKNPVVQQNLGIMDPSLLYPQVETDGDGPMGGGDFGNLDMSRGKEVIREVYQEARPGEFTFYPEKMMAYPNLRSGLYQTEQGKNVDPFLSNTGATFGLAGLAMKMMGMQPKPIGGFVPRSIRGKFDTIADVFRFIGGEDRREAKAAKEAAQQRSFEQAAAAKRNIQQYTGGGGGGRDRAPSSPAKTSQGVTSAQHSAFRN